MITLGVSVYPDLSPLEEIESYLKLASNYGFTRVFSSMFSMEGTNETIIEYFTNFIKVAHKYGMEVSLDVNPGFMKTLGVTTDNISLFDKMNCDILRMDMSYGLSGDLELLNNPYGIKIEFNASSAASSIIEEYLSHGVNKERILACHNFYPQPYTAMKWKSFLEVNAIIAKTNVRCGAFVSSNAENTHGVWDARFGLPTVEKHRHLPIDLQVREMILSENITDILIGNAYASEEEFKSIKEVIDLLEQKPDTNNPMVKMMLANGGDPNRYTPKGILKVTLENDITEVEKDDLFNFFPHMDVGDSSEWIWRSRGPRFAYKDKTIAPRQPKKAVFTRGDIVIINDNYKHYAGEVQIIMQDMPDDGIRNLVGHLDEQEIELLDQLASMQVVRFIKK